MDTNKNYSLFVENIDDAVRNYVSRTDGFSLSIEKPDKTKNIYRLTNGKETGVINIYIKNNGLVSLNVQGAPSLKELCEHCCESVIQQTSIPNSLRKSFTIRNSKVENIELFKLELTDTHKLNITNCKVDGSSIIEHFNILNNSQVKITGTLYSNGTFLMQGNVTSLFIIVLTECLRWLVDNDQASLTGEVISLQNITHSFSEDINILVPNLNVCNDDDGILKRMILTSVVLFNSGVVVEDYGCYTFGILKALEGVLKMRLSEDTLIGDKLGDCYYYDASSHRHRLTTAAYDSTLDLKRALNKGYNIWVSSRHSSFHADEQISTSTLLSYEQAREIFYEAIACINDICNNWN